MTASQSSNNVRLQLFDRRLTLQQSALYLGVTFTSTLHFGKDVESTLKYLNSRLGLISSLRGRLQSCHSSTLLHTYKTFIRPIIDYRAPLLTPFDPQLLRRYLTFERRLFRTNFYLPFRYPSRLIYNISKIPCITERIALLQTKYIRRTLVKHHLSVLLIFTQRPSLLRKPKYKYPFPPAILLSRAADDLPEQLEDYLEDLPLAIR